MKSLIPFLTAITLGLIIALMLGESGWGTFWFIVAAAIGGVTALRAPKWSEQAYWRFVIVILILLAFAWFTITFGRLFYILPLIYILGYMAARVLRILFRAVPAS